MTSIRSFSEILLMDEHLNSDQRQRFVSIIHQESVRLTKLLDEILDLSALEHGESEWVNSPVDAERCSIGRSRYARHCPAEVGDVESGSREIRSRCIRTPIGCRRCSSTSLPMRFRTTMPSPGADHIVDHGETYVVEICDNGPGIPKEYRRKIFEKFVRATPPSDVSTPTSGTGAGAEHQLQYREKAEWRLGAGGWPTAGACFRIILPLEGVGVKAENARVSG